LTKTSFTRQAIFFEYRQLLFHNLCTMTTPTVWPNHSRTVLMFSYTVAKSYIVVSAIKLSTYFNLIVL